MSDYDFNILSKEIRYILTQDRSNYEHSRIYDIQMNWLDNNGVAIPYENKLPAEILKKSLHLQSNYRTKMLVLHNGIVEQSLKSKIERLKNNREIYVINAPFCIEHLKQQEKIQLNENINYYISNEIVKRLYNCKSPLVQNDSSIEHWIKLYENQSIELEKILYKWKQMGKMPIMAKKILQELEVLNNG